MIKWECLPASTVKVVTCLLAFVQWRIWELRSFSLECEYSFWILHQHCIMEDNLLWFTNLIGCTILYMIRKYCTCSGNTYKDNVFIPPWLTLFTSSLFNNPIYGPLNCDWFHCARQQAHSHVYPLLLSFFVKIISKLHLPGKSHLIVNFTVKIYLLHSCFNPYTTATNNIGQKYDGPEYRYQ